MKERNRQIADRVVAGESQSDLAREYGLTRERVRQIVSKAYPNHSSRRAKQDRLDEMIAPHATEMIEARFWFKPLKDIVADKPYTVGQVNDFFVREGGELLERWKEAKARPQSRNADRNGRVCIMCRLYKPWTRFYRDRGRQGFNGHARRCILCAKAQVKHYHNLRNVTEPTVTERTCPSCGDTKPASEYWRATHQNTGLQTYCKSCQREMTRKGRK